MKDDDKAFQQFLKALEKGDVKRAGYLLTLMQAMEQRRKCDRLQ